MNEPAPTPLPRTFFGRVNYWVDEATENPDVEAALGEALKLVEQHRRLECPKYDRCLDQAAEEHWVNFTCAKCPFFNAPPPPDPPPRAHPRRYNRKNPPKYLVLL